MYQFVLLKGIFWWGSRKAWTPYTLGHKFMQTWICIKMTIQAFYNCISISGSKQTSFCNKLPQYSLWETLRPMTWTPIYPGPLFVQVNFMLNTITLTLVVFKNITFYFLQTLKVYTPHTLKPSFVKTLICISHWWCNWISITYSYRNLLRQNIKRGAGMDHHNHFIFYPLFQMFKWSYF